MNDERGDLMALERAIRSLPPMRAPDELRSTLRQDLAAAAAARGAAFPLAVLFASVRRFAYAIIAALFVLGSGWAIAASAPGDPVYPVKEAIVRLMFPAGTESPGVRPIRDIVEAPSATSEPVATSAPSSPAPGVLDGSGTRETPRAPDATGAPAGAPLPSLPPATTPEGPARATPAVTPVPPGPRATPAVPPSH